ncbi:response regulator transcription factor [Oryzobacter sp. R7]|uniref:response regulator transcription factor n=1 Tax=Oryzobacter faecalis TaxID=3388656 RepID=UPI00398C8C45
MAEPTSLARSREHLHQPLVLIVDDDEGIRTVVRWQLHEEGYRTVEAADGRAALDTIATNPPALVVLDLTLPPPGGLDVLKAVRTGATSAPRSLPVIILSGRSGETDRIVGLDLGADDYLVKPFSPGELVARVRSVLRRATTDLGERRTVGPLRIDLGTREVWLDGVAVALTAREFDLVTFFAGHPRQVFSRHQLLERVWQSPDWLGEATVTEHVHRVRRKFDAAGHGNLLRTVRGVGYQLDVSS